jgi:hypothetical protein
MALSLPRRRRTIGKHDRMAQVGIPGDGDHMEPRHGEVVGVPPVGRGRAACVERLSVLLARAIGKVPLYAMAGVG